MRKQLLISALGGSLVALAMVFLASCGGTSGDDKSYSGGSYVADGEIGSISFSTLPSSIPVSQVSGFIVGVRDGSGAGVGDIQVSCDTEEGLALVEPTSGREMTDSSGTMSGKIGCERPGSYQIGCRTPVGANKRVFQRVSCTGEVPDGFTGFPGAGGGGLGGGGLISDDGGSGGADTSGFGIQSARVLDGGIENAFAVDTTQVNTCGDNADEDEPFGDALVSMDFVNDTNSRVDCDSYTITVPGVDTFGPIAVNLGVSGGIAPNGGEAQVTVPLALSLSGGKVWAGSADTISSSTGFKNVELEFTCSKESGDDDSAEFTRSITLGLTFTNVNRCTS